jgi:hypothetical protein
MPIGIVLPWFKDLPGVPALPSNFVECNGQLLNDPESPLDGATMPDINTGAQRFIRGAMPIPPFITAVYVIRVK